MTQPSRNRQSTLRQVAEKAGVHVSTASAILHGGTGNSRAGNATKGAVLKAARELDYRRNEAARRLRRGTSEFVGWIGGDLRNPFFAELTSQLEKSISRLGLRLLCIDLAPGDVVDRAKAVSLLAGQSVRAILIWEEGSTLPIPTSTGMPEVIRLGFTTQSRPGIWLNLNKATRAAVNHLAGQGMTKLGFYAPAATKESAVAAMRLKSFLVECKRAALPLPAVGWWPGESWEIQSASDAAPGLFADHPAVEAWLAFNDVGGLGLLLRRRKTTPPTIFCFDGTTISRNWGPGCDRLDLRIDKLAESAASVLAGQQELEILGLRKNWLVPSVPAG